MSEKSLRGSDEKIDITDMEILKFIVGKEKKKEKNWKQAHTFWKTSF